MEENSLNNLDHISLKQDTSHLNTIIFEIYIMIRSFCFVNYDNVLRSAELQSRLATEP